MKRLSIIFWGLTLASALGIYALAGPKLAFANKGELRPTKYDGEAPKATPAQEISKLFAPKIEAPQDGMARQQAEMVLNYLVHADDHGLKTIDIAPMYETLQSGKDLDQNQKTSLVEALVKFGNEVNGSRVNWEYARKDWDMRPVQRDIRAELVLALQNGTLHDFLEGLAPPHDAYRALVGARNKYAQITANGGFVKIDNGIGLKLGSDSPQVTILRQRLAQEGYVASPSPTPNLFDESLKQQLDNFQKAHGMNYNGEMTERTLAALNISADTRLKQIDLNLERERWVPRSNAPTRIEANIPSATLVYYVDNKPALSMPTIVGKTSTKTPMFASNVRTIVLNPPWFVPRSISARRRVQPPGPNNALGRVKFDFDNKFSVYLHDTPNHALFSANKRAFSHGCVRLDKPKDLAALLLRPEGYDRKRIDEITSTVQTHYIKLQSHTPVMLLYRTAYVAKLPNSQDVVHFVDDVYEWDGLLANLLDPNYKPLGSARSLATSDTPITAAP